MITIGIDPDLHFSGLAVVEDGRILEVRLATVPRQIKRASAVIGMASSLIRVVDVLASKYRPDLGVVEGQQVYVGKTPSRVVDILRLGQVAGAAVAALLSWQIPVCLPEPQVWKGTTPKHIHQARICDRFGIGYELRGEKKPVRVTSWPEPLQAPTLATWSHAVDAVGLAEWRASR